MTLEDCKKLGMPVLSKTEVTEEALSAFNRPDIRAVGVPSAGGFANAHDLALFYQALMHGGLNGVGLWTGSWSRGDTTHWTYEMKQELEPDNEDQGESYTKLY